MAYSHDTYNWQAAKDVGAVKSINKALSEILAHSKTAVIWGASEGLWRMTNIEPDILSTPNLILAYRSIRKHSKYFKAVKVVDPASLSEQDDNLSFITSSRSRLIKADIVADTKKYFPRSDIYHVYN